MISVEFIQNERGKCLTAIWYSWHTINPSQCKIKIPCFCLCFRRFPFPYQSFLYLFRSSGNACIQYAVCDRRVECVYLYIRESRYALRVWNDLQEVRAPPTKALSTRQWVSTHMMRVCEREKEKRQVRSAYPLDIILWIHYKMWLRSLSATALILDHHYENIWGMHENSTLVCVTHTIPLLALMWIEQTNYVNYCQFSHHNTQCGLFGRKSNVIDDDDDGVMSYRHRNSYSSGVCGDGVIINTLFIFANKNLFRSTTTPSTNNHFAKERKENNNNNTNDIDISYTRDWKRKESQEFVYEIPHRSHCTHRFIQQAIYAPECVDLLYTS